jgi:hypothetical protein
MLLYPGEQYRLLGASSFYHLTFSHKSGPAKYVIKTTYFNSLYMQPGAITISLRLITSIEVYMYCINLMKNIVHASIIRRHDADENEKCVASETRPTGATGNQAGEESSETVRKGLIPHSESNFMVTEQRQVSIEGDRGLRVHAARSYHYLSSLITSIEVYMYCVNLMKNIVHASIIRIHDALEK